VSISDTISLVAVFSGPILAGLATVAGAWIGRRSGVKQAEIATEKAVQIASEQAKISSREATTAAREAVTADWEAYTGLLLRRLEAVESRATAAERRIDTAEARAIIAEERAIRWESLYRIAVTHMREVIKWASNVGQQSEMPPAPPELISDL
jgi:hypothetical protein